MLFQLLLDYDICLSSNSKNLPIFLYILLIKELGVAIITNCT